MRRRGVDANFSGGEPVDLDVRVSGDELAQLEDEGRRPFGLPGGLGNSEGYDSAGVLRTASQNKLILSEKNVCVLSMVYIFRREATSKV